MTEVELRASLRRWVDETHDVALLGHLHGVLCASAGPSLWARVDEAGLAKIDDARRDVAPDAWIPHDLVDAESAGWLSE